MAPRLRSVDTIRSPCFLLVSTGQAPAAARRRNLSFRYLWLQPLFVYTRFSCKFDKGNTKSSTERRLNGVGTLISRKLMCRRTTIDLLCDPGNEKNSVEHDTSLETCSTLFSSVHQYGHQTRSFEMCRYFYFLSKSAWSYSILWTIFIIKMFTSFVFHKSGSGNLVFACTSNTVTKPVPLKLDVSFLLLKILGGVSTDCIIYSTSSLTETLARFKTPLLCDAIRNKKFFAFIEVDY
ncbi:hypothetical protein HPP92_009626 [Vanilla planifolia]|uniref:Uncharacterized protein n=1 Tax=Vanilla planifolia TaxID=51239 RepID=A0A835RGJ5_VANPL|nr:hypothetical protein HPP92_009626 [Vanilla planifolia]